jgi:hypothetical protein
VSTYNLPFTLTSAGIDAAFNLGAIDLNVTHVQIGSGNKTPNGSEVALVSPQEYAAITGHFEVSAGQHRIAAVIPGSASVYNISEIGLWSGVPGDVGSVLVFYWALASGHVTVKSASIDFNFENDMFFGGVVPANITIVADTQFNALAMLVAHEAEADPHAQYHLKTTVATETEKGIAEIATQSETNAGTDDTRIVTPLKLRYGFAISWGDSGYIAFPTWLGGFIFQWIHTSIDNTEISKLITLPTAFTQMIGATRYAMTMAHHFNSTSLGNSPMLVSSFAESLSQVRVTKNTSGIGVSGGNVSIYAIGR